MVAVEVNEGTIWTPEFMRVLYDVTDDIFYLPGVFRSSVTSMWTPNTRVLQITEEGFLAYNLIPSNVTRDNITQEDVDAIGLSSLSGAHETLFRKVLKLLKERKAGNILVFGGGIIPKDDADNLKQLGIVEIFGPGSYTKDIVSRIESEIKKKRGESCSTR